MASLADQTADTRTVARPSHGLRIMIVETEGGAGMTTDRPRIAVRCSSCGRRSTIEGLCSECGHDSHVPLDSLASLSDAAGSLGNSLFPSESQALTNAQPPTTLALGSSRSRKSRSFLQSAEIEGRVIIVRQAPHEPMDFDPWRWLAIPVWGLALLTTPCAIAIVVWQTYGFLVALGFSVVALMVLRFIFSNRLMQSWHLTAALNGRHVVEPMPVVMARLREIDERETQLRLKGHMHGGSLMEGDRIRAIGSWRRGVFRVNAIVCQRTGASICPCQPNARRLAIIGSGSLLLGVLWLYFAGVPWVNRELDKVRDSLHQPHFQTIIDPQSP